MTFPKCIILITFSETFLAHRSLLSSRQLMRIVREHIATKKDEKI